MKLFSTVAQSLEPYNKIIDHVNRADTPILCVGLSAIHKAHFIYAASRDMKEPLLVVTQDEASATRLCADMNIMAEEERCLLFPARDFTYREMEGVSGEYEQARLGVLSRLVKGEAKVVVASIQAIMTRTMPRKVLIESTFTVQPDTAIPLDELVRKLIRSGYVRREQVEGFCQFSVRGGIIDIFPPNEANPIRVEYWGDEIDTMSYFELDSQRRTERVEKIDISPAREVSFGNGE
ncbi:MAG: transcription-repair coupling factor, partial [Oscillospiraceae bacterium]